MTHKVWEMKRERTGDREKEGEVYSLIVEVRSENQSSGGKNVYFGFWIGKV